MKPLEGIRVLDLSRMVAGGIAGMLMADFGAEVVKIEQPGSGDPLRQWTAEGKSLWWKVYARNKRFVTLNLKAPEGRDLLLRMLPEYDVLMESFVPGTLERLGLDWDTLRARHAGLILLRISGWGQSGPDSARPGFGTLVEAASGFAEMNGEPNGGPIVPGFPLADSVSALYASNAVMYALYHRDVRGGGGQVIDLSLFESLFSLLGPLPAEYAVTGRTRRRDGSSSRNAGPRGCYSTSDGHWIAVSGSTPKMAERFLRSYGLEHLLEDPRFATNGARVDHQRELDIEVTRAISQRTLAENVEIIEQNHLTAVPVQTIADIEAHPHWRARGLTLDVPNGSSAVRMHTVVPRMSATPGEIKWAGGELGQDNHAVYGALGLSCEDQQRLRAGGVIERAMSDAEKLRGRLLIGGEWQAGTRPPLDVLDKFTGATIGVVECAGREQVNAAVAAARASFEQHPLDAQERYQRLHRTAQLLEQSACDFASLIVTEGGLPITDATAEVGRAVQTLTIAAEEAKRLVGEVVPIEAAPGAAHHMAFTIRVPRGVVCGVAAFNSPLNMICHKVAPALASGNAVVMKTSELAPLTATRLFELLLEAGFPPGHLSLIHGPGEDVGPWLVENTGIDFYTFTGSARVGAWVREDAGVRPVLLELGSISPTIVCDDADQERAASRCAASAFRRAGQVCTSTQRLFVQRGIEPAFSERFKHAVAALKVGDPRDPATDIGPMISEREAIRAESWVKDAVAAGATLVHGGTRKGAVLQPTVLANVDGRMRVMSEEIFAPVVSLVTFDTLDEAFALANDTPFGLAAGIFTKDITRAMTAARRLRVGLLHVNDASSSRVDLIPFGGVKQSGIGREGPKYTMQEMTEERLVTFNLT